MKKKIFISIIVLFSLPLFIYISFELSLKIIAIPYVSKINHNEYFDAEDRFNRALWIYYTDDKEMELKKITLFSTIYKLTKADNLMQIIKDSDNVVYMASRYIYAESKKRNLTGLEWQVT